MHGNPHQNIFKEAPMISGKDRPLTLLDRSLIGLLLFIVMLLLGIQAVHAAGG